MKQSVTRYLDGRDLVKIGSEVFVARNQKLAQGNGSDAAFKEATLVYEMWLRRQNNLNKMTRL